jgi:hypothetical protein
MMPGEPPPSLPLERTHLGRDDLDWLPPSWKAVRWTVAGSIWTGLGVATAATIAFGKIQPYFYGKAIAALAAGGFYAGDRVARAALRRRLSKLARGAIDLQRLSREADGELIHVRGRVHARATVPGLVTGGAAVYRRMLFTIGGVRLVHEAAVDFSLVDGSGEAVTVLAADARLLAPEPRLKRLEHSVVEQLGLLPLPPGSRAELTRWNERRARGKRVQAIEGGEVLLTDGAAVEVVGYKTRIVDPSVASRLERDTPMRATLRSGRELPLIISPGGREG